LQQECQSRGEPDISVAMAAFRSLFSVDERIGNLASSVFDSRREPTDAMRIRMAKLPPD
jgi:hypothetical protein